MQTSPTPLADQKKNEDAITVLLNRKDVTFHNKKVTGLQIKETAIQQGVEIQLDFVLFQVRGHGKLDPVPDTQEVTLNKNDEFRAVTPDDKS